MRKQILIRSILPVLAIFTFSFIVLSPAQAAAFAKFDGVDGESQDAQHDKWIDLQSISESISRPDSGSTGGTRRRGPAVFDDLVLVKELDRSSVKLREGLADGRVYPKLEIELTRTFGGSRHTYFKYELKNVQITSFSLDASGSDAVPATEVVKVNFEEIKWTYTIFDATGAIAGVVEASWRIEEGL